MHKRVTTKEHCRLRDELRSVAQQLLSPPTRSNFKHRFPFRVEITAVSVSKHSLRIPLQCFDEAVVTIGNQDIVVSKPVQILNFLGKCTGPSIYRSCKTLPGISDHLVAVFNQ